MCVCVCVFVCVFVDIGGWMNDKTKEHKETHSLRYSFSAVNARLFMACTVLRLCKNNTRQLLSHTAVATLG